MKFSNKIYAIITFIIQWSIYIFWGFFLHEYLNCLTKFFNYFFKFFKKMHNFIFFLKKMHNKKCFQKKINFFFEKVGKSEKHPILSLGITNDPRTISLINNIYRIIYMKNSLYLPLTSKSPSNKYLIRSSLVTLIIL